MARRYLPPLLSAFLLAAHLFPAEARLPPRARREAGPFQSLDFTGAGGIQRRQLEAVSDITPLDWTLIGGLGFAVVGITFAIVVKKARAKRRRAELALQRGQAVRQAVEDYAAGLNAEEREKRMEANEEYIRRMAQQIQMEQALHSEDRGNSFDLGESDKKGEARKADASDSEAREASAVERLLEWGSVIEAPKDLDKLDHSVAWVEDALDAYVAAEASPEKKAADKELERLQNEMSELQRRRNEKAAEVAAATSELQKVPLDDKARMEEAIAKKKALEEEQEALEKEKEKKARERNEVEAKARERARMEGKARRGGG